MTAGAGGYGGGLRWRLRRSGRWSKPAVMRRAAAMVEVMAAATVEVTAAAMAAATAEVMAAATAAEEDHVFRG